MSKNEEALMGLGCVGGIIAVVVLFCVSMFGGCMPNYSVGSRSGELIKVSNKGIVFKSWECDVQLSEFGLRGGNQSGWTNVFKCSTTDAALGAKLESLMGKRVVIKYHQYFIKPIQQSEGYTIADVQEAKP